MAVLFMDGFSHYATADIAKKWTTRIDSNAVWAIEPATGRTAGCIRKTSTSNFSGAYLVKGPTVKQGSIWSPQQSGICGFALKVDDLNRINPGLHSSLIEVFHGFDPQFTVGLNKDGTISIWIPAGYDPSIKVVATSISAISNASWAYLEFKWTIHKTTGNFVLRANGIEIMNYNGELAYNSYPFQQPPNLWTSVRFLSIGSETPPYLNLRACDFYLSDFSSPNGNFLGDISIAYIIPDAVGNSTGWIPSGANPNWQNVREVPPNSDVDYNSAIAIGSKDLYSFTPVTANPVAMQHCIFARRTAPGAVTLEAVVRHGGVDLVQPVQSIQNETYAYNLYPYDTNPATGIKWTQADANAAEFGVNKAS
jgi:hypothetical protein